MGHSITIKTLYKKQKTGIGVGHQRKLPGDFPSISNLETAVKTDQCFAIALGR